MNIHMTRPTSGSNLPQRLAHAAHLPEFPHPTSLQVRCPACQKQGREWYGSLSLAQPPVRQFWQEQDKIRLLPTQNIEIGGRLGLVVPFASVSNQAGIAVVLAQDTYEILHVVGTHSVEQ